MRIKKYVLIFIFAVTALLVVSGCSSTKKIAEDDEEQLTGNENLSADRLLTKLESNRRKIKSFEGSGTIHIKTSEMDNTATFRTKIAKPDSIYINLLGPFSMDLAKILVSSNEFQFYDALQNTLYKGELNENILKSIFKIDISLTDLVDGFAGSVNLTKRLYKQPDELKLVGTSYSLTYNEDNNTRIVYFINAKTLVIEEMKILDAANNLIFLGKYSNFNEVENSVIPFKIIIQNIQQDQMLEINYKKAEINTEGFSIDFKAASDAQVIEW